MLSQRGSCCLQNKQKEIMFLLYVRKAHPNCSKVFLDSAMEHSIHAPKLAVMQVDLSTRPCADINCGHRPAKAASACLGTHAFLQHILCHLHYTPLHDACAPSTCDTSSSTVGQVEPNAFHGFRHHSKYYYLFKQYFLPQKHLH